MDTVVPDSPPLILTIDLDQNSFAKFDAERRRYFPSDRNHIPAHLTLFHQLPGNRIADICDLLAMKAAQEPPFPLLIFGMRFLGRGTAYEVASSKLTVLRNGLAERWRHHLTKQDAQGFRPHITVQNKVDTIVAKETFDALSAAFTPFEATATGLTLWHYRGGPWEAAATIPFSA